jgi:cell wall-associated NlpC family hydrolase
MRRTAGAVAALLIMLPLVLLSARPASASVSSYQRAAVVNWAVTQAGKPYVYGSYGPNGYDCSGLVYAAYLRIRLTLPRTTYGMLGSWHLYRVRYPVRGDLAFYGSGHVEFYISGRTTFGALHAGTRLGYHTWNAYWHPTAFYRVY